MGNEIVLNIDDYDDDNNKISVYDRVYVEYI